MIIDKIIFEGDKTIVLPKEKLGISLEGNYSLVVFNDDVNSFEHVIETLIEVCKHSREQAEQCTWIIHHKGKYVVKTGEYEVLANMCQAICDRDISAEVYGSN